MQLRQNKKEFNTEHFFEDDKYDFSQNEKEVFTYKDNPEMLIANTEFTQTEILDAITLLPTGFRTVLNMYVLEGFKHKEISDRLEISVGTSKSQLLRARKKLEDILYKIAINKVKDKRDEEQN
jgi:RNA polymerase sigma-70 factor (ECF subfamily)